MEGLSSSFLHQKLIYFKYQVGTNILETTTCLEDHPTK